MEGEGKALAPWEQHSAVISIPRFDYKAPSAILERPRSGFLVTCPIKREKSATKEAITILEKHVAILCNYSDNIAPSDVHAEKRRKIDFEEMESGSMSNSEGKEALDTIEGCESAVAEGSTPSNLKSDKDRFNLSLVKLGKSGLLLLTFHCDDSQKPVRILTNILQSLEVGDMKTPQWCHRIFPIQETCILKEKHLFDVVSKLVKNFFDDGVRNLENPIKFAVGYDRRGMDETEKKAPEQINELGLLDRNECFKVVAKAVKHVAVESTVDLKSPELIILIELLPISGVPNGSIIAGVSVLSRELVSTKPRLCVKTLVSDVKKR